MSLKKLLIFAITLYCYLSTPCFSMENAFYILRPAPHVKSKFDQDAFTSLSQHYQSINILISQAYRINQQGLVAGYMDKDIIQFSRQHNLKIIAMVTNSGFDKDKVHLFLQNRPAQKNAINTLLVLCQENHLNGIQFDFEGVSRKDRLALTKFYHEVYDAFHAKGYLVSFAVVPLVADGKQPTDFQQRKYDNWGGAYDLAALSKYSDFITIMSYDQHTQGTTPGPTANIRWVEATLKYTLHYVPANKISLGIPTYSGYWYIRDQSHGKLRVNLDDISYQQADNILKKFRVKLNWDNDSKINFAFYQRDWLNEYLFVEDARSFKAKYNLAKKYGIRGISVFNLGNEDPRIWKTALCSPPSCTNSEQSI